MTISNNSLALSLITITFIYTLIGCSSDNNPNEVITEYIEAELNEDYQKMYSLLSESDKQTYTLNEYSQVKSGEDAELAILIKKNTNYQIKGIEIENSSAVAIVEFQRPDIMAMMGDFFLNAFNNAMVDTSEIVENIEEQIESDAVTYETFNEEYFLVLQSDGWKIFEDLQLEKKRIEVTDEANEIIKQIDGYMSKFDYNSAKESFEKLNSLEADLLDENIIDKIESFSNQLDLITEIDIYDIESRYINTGLNRESAGIRFKIRNNSDYDLNRVKVNVFYLDENDRTIYEESYTPVVVSEYSIGDNQPLKAGYIYQMPDRRFWTSDSVPSEWQEGNVNVGIAEIQIAQ